MKIKYITLFILLITGNVFGQDLHFSQFQMTPLQLDPSQAGKFGGDQRAIINYRDQWRGVSNPYKTFGASFDSRLTSNKNFLGGGVSLYNDRAGDIDMGLLSLNLSLAYHVRVSQKGYFSGGLNAGFLQRSIDPSKLEFDNQYDGTGHNASYSSNEYISNSTFMQPDFSAGISYSYGTTNRKIRSNNGYDGQKVNIGLAVQHLSNSKFSFLGDKTQHQAFRYLMHFNTSFGVQNSLLAVQPSGFVAYQQGAFEFTVGSYFRYTLKEKSRYTGRSGGSAFSFGTHIRTGDALILSTLIEVGSLALGFSYDINVSKLQIASNSKGGFEVSIRFINPNPFKTIGSHARFF